MVHSIKVAASAFATVLALVAYIPYLVDMFRGKNKPHLYTWISIFLVTIVITLIQLTGGAGLGIIPMILTVCVDTVILFYCFQFGTKDVVLMDKFCLAASVVGIVVYILLHNAPLVSLGIVTIAEIISFIPTIRKTRNDPYSESLPSYYLVLLKLFLITAALQKYNLLTVSYSALWSVVFVGYLSATYRWRAHARNKRALHEIEEAPLI